MLWCAHTYTHIRMMRTYMNTYMYGVCSRRKSAQQTVWKKYSCQLRQEVCCIAMIYIYIYIYIYLNLSRHLFQKSSQMSHVIFKYNNIIIINNSNHIIIKLNTVVQIGRHAQPTVRAVTDVEVIVLPQEHVPSPLRVHLTGENGEKGFHLEFVCMSRAVALPYTCTCENYKHTLKEKLHVHMCVCMWTRTNVSI